MLPHETGIYKLNDLIINFEIVKHLVTYATLFLYERIPDCRVQNLPFVFAHLGSRRKNLVCRLITQKYSDT